jgi:ubiquinone/menaquinone biosynthesis C-methylase UbiE
MGLFRKTSIEPLAVTMAGVKLGHRLLAVGTRDPKLIAQLAVKAGLTGRTCVVDDDERRLAAGAAAIEREGALVEPTRAPYGMLPFDAESFDVAVIPDLFPALPAETRARCAMEVYRVLRPGGRAMAIEPAPRTGLAALLKGERAEPAYQGAAATLRDAGFTAVRDVAKADGVLYVEGIKRG